VLYSVHASTCRWKRTIIQLLFNYSTQTLFFSLPADTRKQLYRAYMELVCYVPWKESPEESFLYEMQRSVLKDAAQDPEKDHRYSLRRLQMYWQVYMGGSDEK